MMPIIYLDDIEPNKNNIVLSIKTDAKYAVTIGTIELPPTDIENHPYLNDEENLLSGWNYIILRMNHYWNY